MKGRVMAGLYNKYHIEKTDGAPVDPEAVYFVLRLDTDREARDAAKAYALACAERGIKHELARDPMALVRALEREFVADLADIIKDIRKEEQDATR